MGSSYIAYEEHFAGTRSGLKYGSENTFFQLLDFLGDLNVMGMRLIFQVRWRIKRGSKGLNFL